MCLHFNTFGMLVPTIYNSLTFHWIAHFYIVEKNSIIQIVQYISESF